MALTIRSLPEVRRTRSADLERERAAAAAGAGVLHQTLRDLDGLLRREADPVQRLRKLHRHLALLVADANGYGSLVGGVEAPIGKLAHQRTHRRLQFLLGFGVIAAVRHAFSPFGLNGISR